MVEARFTIKTAARHTGLSAHVLRIWEKRYGAVAPARTPTNRRLYSAEQVERLNLLRDLTHAGHSIGQVAKLPTGELRKLAAEAGGANGHAGTAPPAPPESPSFLDESVDAVKKFDFRGLETALQRAETELGALGLLQRVLAPLARSVGDGWRNGTLTAAHEHFATAAIRVLLGNLSRPFATGDNAPVLVAVTPAGQLHELGALLAGAMAANLGWQVIYLGASLPAAEIAGAARQNRARAVALSIVYPEDDPRLEGELTRLRELLPAEIPLLVGGRAIAAYRPALEKIGAVLVDHLDRLGSTLDALRQPAKKAKR